ncbi:MAG: triphosphoribosyl-dephospho-CoA synthase [Thermodesulfobacteriota bacterium]
MSSGRKVTVSGKRIAQAAQMACLLEVSAPKPGNVNRYNDFADARFEDFLLSAVAIGPAIEGAGRAGVGQTILRAIRDTRQRVRSNTNLGMILLLAPLAKACLCASRLLRPGTAPGNSATVGAGELRESLALVLDKLTVEDARQAYAGIRLAQPGGLGPTPEADVADEPSITLYQAMALAQERDAIAREYVTDFAITFGIGYPALMEAQSTCDDLSKAIVQAFLTILAQVPDTLIARKRGTNMAGQVSQWARDVLTLGGGSTVLGRARLAELDRALRDEGHTLNPGTTADLTAATLFLFLLNDS